MQGGKLKTFFWWKIAFVKVLDAITIPPLQLRENLKIIAVLQTIYLLGWAWASLILVWSTGPCASTDRSADRLTDRPIVSVPFMWYWYVARAHAATAPYHAHVNSAVRIVSLSQTLTRVWLHETTVRSGDSYKTDENADDGKAKSRDTCTMNCEAWTRDQWMSSYLHLSVLPSSAFTYVSFSRRSLHTNPFSHCILHKMHASCIQACIPSHLACCAAPCYNTAQARPQRWSSSF